MSADMAGDVRPADGRHGAGVLARCRWFGHRWTGCGCLGGWGERRLCERCGHHEHAAIYPHKSDERAR